VLLYWILFTAPIAGGLPRRSPDPLLRNLVVALVFAALVVVIGWRDQIGCDWDTYLNHYYNLSAQPLGQALARVDPGYALVNWIAGRTGLGMHGVNAICGAIFSVGLIAFVRRQPLPWLALAVAVPYLTIVVAMGYTRQATAIGLLMLALNAFVDRKVGRYLLLVALAVTFHKTAIAFAPAALFIRVRQPWAPFLLVLAATAAMFSLFVSESLDRLTTSYIESGYAAEGGLYRVTLNAAAALAFFACARRWRARYADFRLFMVMSAAMLLAAPLVFVYSVVADRMSLYLLPIQIAVFARIPHLLGGTRWAAPATLAVLAGYGLLLGLWLRLANHAYCWTPYRSALF
jgi:hypothetical protein